MNCVNVRKLRLGQRFRLRVVVAIEDFALSAIPRGSLRRRLLDRVDREFQRINTQGVNAALGS